MAHGIEHLADGSDAFVSARTPAWHRLGTVFDGDALTAAQVMDLAHLGGWNVRKLAVTATELGGDGVTTLEVPGKYAVARTNPATGATEVNGGVVGSQWTPVQNEETCEFLQAVVDESGAVFQTAGSLHGGTDVFVTMRLPGTMMVGGRDAVDSYISAFNNHDGTAAFRATVSPVRVVCANTQAMNLRAAKSRFSIRHTTNAAKAIEQARQALSLSWKYLEGFQAEADAMLAAAMTDKEFDDFLTDAVIGGRPVLGEKTDGGAKATAKSIEAYDLEFGTLRHLFRGAETQELIRGTRWAAYQSIVEYVDWAVPVSGKRPADEVRALRTVTGDNAAFKAQAYELLAVS